jgi:hypothetical protein
MLLPILCLGKKNYVTRQENRNAKFTRLSSFIIKNQETK